MNFRQRLSERLIAWDNAGLRRYPHTFSSAQDPHVKDGFLFASSNYLSLSTHPKLVEAAHRALDRYGCGSGGSRLTTGTLDLHRELEAEIAEWLGYEDCVLFSSGFIANLAVLSTFGDSSVTISSDERNHASLIDGCRLARADVKVYPHRQLGKLPPQPSLIVTDGVFSMDGTVADVDHLSTVRENHDAMLVVDDAHGIGTLFDGRGCCAPLIDSGRAPDILIGTASKALGSEGAFVACDHTQAEILRNQGRPYVFTTSNPAPVIAATLAAVRILRSAEGQERITRLHRNVAHLRSGLDAPTGQAPIIPIHIGSEQRALSVANYLSDHGFIAPAIRYPTVTKGKAIIRATVMADHSAGDIDDFISAVKDALQKNPT
ncbi:aminotransferase class I/II-fold pyridoxal phosphate-dependent enzyme [Corynebacterium tapiri]|uniref:8-amino-7-oxononanoate synthase n=1 Tax=Corynebacterium tapiri TaxID=1448266 RepID=A0A5C4U5N7_9CORY|nr:8-amino-7-oxononanoate synthase [Corynebacterium tapiri]TNL97629.1 8-amino-7-oxononanoate synthase [Corynebacterium tapiri]